MGKGRTAIESPFRQKEAEKQRKRSVRIIKRGQKKWKKLGQSTCSSKRVNILGKEKCDLSGQSLRNHKNIEEKGVKTT